MSVFLLLLFLLPFGGPALPDHGDRHVGIQGESLGASSGQIASAFVRLKPDPHHPGFSKNDHLLHSTEAVTLAGPTAVRLFFSAQNFSSVSANRALTPPTRAPPRHHSPC